ncbi:hypothetical protein O3M35_012371 [Rhynocoris fuscipes]|uniref:Gamma-secretase subunit Aph-1 n=1 Tax=Rhynocoris fuscipes TaxID=488301 RepID=A0AAW1CXV7_9HEMI
MTLMELIGCACTAYGPALALFIITIIHDPILSVIFQEAFRYFIYILLRKAETGLKKMHVPNTNTDLLNNKHIVPYVSGLGYGVMSGAFSLGNVLAELSGPGTMGLNGGSHFFCLITSIFTMIFTLLHTFWSVIFFNGVDVKNYFLIGWVIGSHLLISCMSLFNSSQMYYLTLTPAIVILVISSYLAFNVCRHKYVSGHNVVVHN